MTASPVTTPEAWAAATAGHPAAVLDVHVGRLLVVAAHPDDETLAAAGYLRAVHHAGGAIVIVVATDGEAACPELPPDRRAELAGVRRAELHTALAAAGIHGATVRWLGLPDSGLAAVEHDLTEALRPYLAETDQCLAPWEHDPHPDHAAAGRAALAAAPAHVHRIAYPIWTWPWSSPDDDRIPWAQLTQHRLDPAARTAKRAALAAFGSQTGPAPGGGAAILPPDVMAHFAGDRELFFRVPPTASAPADRFARLYAGDSDPWRTATSWYERRKRDIVLACLPRESYAHAAEPGCGTGLLTRALARRCRRVSASDYTPAAVAATTAATAGTPGVDVTEGALPDPATIPDGVDLVVLSEMLYYLAADDVRATADRIAAAALPDADVVLVHWRGRPAEAPQDAAATHAVLTGDPRFAVVVEHVDAEFLLHVLHLR